MPEMKSTCCYCGVGCGVVIETDGGQVTGVHGDSDHPANFGRLCTKGATLHLTAGSSARAFFPQLRASRGTPRKRVSRDEALDFPAAGFAAVIRKHGPDSVAFYVSGQLLTEDYYAFNKLAKGLIGTNNNAALVNLHLATRHIGRPGAGPLSLTGQPNAMGGREVGGMANLLSAHRDLADPEHRAEVARLWGVDSLPEKSGCTAVEMFDAIGRGEIKAVWIACTNPAQSMPNQKQVRSALERAELVLLESLQPFLERFDYATLGLSGRDDVVVVLRGYAAGPVADAVLDALDRLLDLHEAERTMRYVDARRRVEKAARIEDGMVQSVCLSGETAAQEWLKNMMVQGASAEAMRSWILAPAAVPPRGSFNRGATVCNCFDISETEIRTVLATGADLAQLQRRLKCGTDCGSCMPELKRMCASAEVRCQDSGLGEQRIAALSSESSAESRITNH